MSNELQTVIDAAWEKRDGISSATKGAVRDAVEAAIAGLDDGSYRTAEKFGDEWVVNQWLEEGRPALLPALRFGADGRRRVVPRPGRGAVVRQGAAQDHGLGRQALRQGRLPRRAGLDRAPRLLRGALRRGHAVLHQSRRLCRHRHHGRHLGDGGLVRPDRQELPSLGRRRHRRRARAVAGQPGDRRGQLLHRRALRGRRGRDRRHRLSAVDGRLHLGQHQDRRSRDRPDPCRQSAALFRGPPWHHGRQCRSAGPTTA